MNVNESGPRIALLIEKGELLAEIAEILKIQYSSLILITEKEELDQFARPLLVIVDHIKEVAAIKNLSPSGGTRILVILEGIDSEETGAAFDVGVDDYLRYPFDSEVLLAKVATNLRDGLDGTVS